MKENNEIVFGVLCKLFVLVLVGIVVALTTGCATAPKSAGTRSPMYVVTNYTSSVTTTGTNKVSVVNTQTQSFLKPQRRWSLMGLVFGEKDPIPTTVPSGQSVQQGEPAPNIIVVEQPYGYGYPYARVPARSWEHRRLLGVRYRIP